MFWIIAGIVVVVLFATAWLASGRSKIAPKPNLSGEAKQDEAKGRHELRTRTGQFPGGVG